MISAKFLFPQKFTWGTAISSHQVEGGHPDNNWTAWEKQPGRIFENGLSNPGCDWWGGGRWREDLTRAAESGQNAHRFSIEWARVQPTPDSWDESAIDFYREIMRAMIERGLRPMVTLHHFTDPLWFTEQGGWLNPAAPALFRGYVEKIVPALKELTNEWITINEPNVYIYNGYLTGAFPPGKAFALKEAAAVLRIMIEAHAAAYRAIHERQPEAAVSIAINHMDFMSKTPALPDRWTTAFFDRVFNRSFIDVLAKGSFSYGPLRIRSAAARNAFDFLGLNYYTGKQVRFSTDLNLAMSFPPGASLSDTGFLANEPDSFANALRWAGSYGKPVVVTENGVENDEDSFRREYIGDQIYQLWRAISAGIPVTGYYHWSLVDNFEWERGWTQRFGLWRLDLATGKREKRPSADFYAAICRKNALEAEDLKTYAPVVYDRIFKD